MEDKGTIIQALRETSAQLIEGDKNVSNVGKSRANRSRTRALEKKFGVKIDVSAPLCQDVQEWRNAYVFLANELWDLLIDGDDPNLRKIKKDMENLGLDPKIVFYEDV